MADRLRGELTDHLADRLGDDDLAGDPSLQDVLYPGESVTATVDVDGGEFAVTGHRVLAHTPETDGRTLRSVERPNVADVSLTSRGWTRPLAPAVRAGVVGAICLGVGLSVSLDGLVGAVSVPDAAGLAGLGALAALLSTLQRLLALLDDLLVAAGAVGLLVGVAGLGAWLWTRSTVLVVECEGEVEDLLVDAGDVDDDDVRAVRDAVRYE
ncbi:MAG: hypothetical protein ABEJ79_05820 [Halolamina sp.]